MIRIALVCFVPPLFTQTVLYLYLLYPPFFQHDECVVDVVRLPYLQL
jgi:hypothetical protein